MAKKFKYKYLGGPFTFHDGATCFTNGYLSALKDAGLPTDGIKSVICMRTLGDDMRDGYYDSKGAFYRDGFYCVKKIALTAAEIKEKEENYKPVKKDFVYP